MENNIPKFERESNKISISSFHELYDLDKYSFPNYQRNDSVWGVEQQSFLIDSIMKNFPIPSIFLKSITDPSTGKTNYEVIDGQQRLTSIIKFIKNDISLPDSFGEDRWGDESLNGLTLKEIPSESPYRKNFWSYQIPVEYIESDDDESISTIFDRLNRNGEPLNNQELRNSKYKSSYLLEKLKQLALMPYWSNLLENLVGKNRMQDIDFISELFFTIAEGNVLDSSPTEIDNLYSKWVKLPEDKVDEVEIRFKSHTEFLNQLDLDYKHYKVFGVSHIYGLWLLAGHCIEKDLSPFEVKPLLENFFEQVRQKNYSNPYVAEYKSSMSYGTRNRSQRQKRVNSLVSFIS